MQSDQFQLHGDIEHRHWWFVARRRIIGELVRQLVPPQSDPQRQSTIIDVGCGTGANAAALAEHYRCIGIDTSAEAVSLAAQRFPNVTFRVGYAPDDLADCMASASLIMLNDVLEHVDDDFELLSKLLAAAQPGTYFLLTVPADMSLWSIHDESFGHYRRYDKDRFQRVWNGLPVKQRLLSYFNSRLYPIVRMIRTWNRKRGGTSGRVGTDFKMPGRLANWLLTTAFGGERHKLGRMLKNDSPRSYPFGVSLIAVLQREQGDVQIRSKPVDVAADHFDPQAESLLQTCAAGD